MIGRVRSGYGNIIIKRRALVYVSVVVSLVAIGVISAQFISRYVDRAVGKDGDTALAKWNAGDYQAVYDLSVSSLQSRPLSSYWLVLHGLSAYQLGVAQINRTDMDNYIDESIAAMRKALLVGADSMDARARYVLGKAYYRKGPEYADLSIDFLKQAIDSKYVTDDIYEHLGLAYAELGDYRNSVIAFTQALGIRSSDLLLLAIARSYLALKEVEQAMPYLIRCSEESKDALIIGRARLLLGDIYKDAGKLDAAEQEYMAVLSMNDKNVDAYFSLGELYAISGDSVKARAEWRKALRIDPAHGPSRERLGI